MHGREALSRRWLALARARPSPPASPTLLCPQISDGAAAVLLMTRAEATKRGLPVLGIFRSFAAVGVDPAVMGIGPAVAIPEAVKMAGLSVDDIDLFELNEAFASQARAGPLGRVVYGVKKGWYSAVTFSLPPTQNTTPGRLLRVKACA